MMNTVETSCSYMAYGKLMNNSFEIRTNDVNKLFDNAILDAKFAETFGNGKVMIDRTEFSLYISYLDVKGSHVIDRLYRIKH